MADKDYSNSKYYEAPAASPSPQPVNPTPSIQKVGKIVIPKITGSKYSNGGTGAVAPTAPRTTPTTFDEAVNRQIEQVRNVAGNALLGAAGSAIDIISSPLAYFSGQEKIIRELSDKGIVTPFMEAYLTAKATPPSMGTGAASAAVRLPAANSKLVPKVTVTNKAEADKINKLIGDAAWSNATAWTRGEKVSYGAQVIFGDKEEYDLGEIIAGLSYDIVNDPLTFAGQGTISAIKAAAKSGKAAVTAGTRALKSEVSTVAAKSTQVKKTGEALDLPIERVVEPKIKTKKSELQTASALGVDLTSEIERIRRLGTYTTTKVAPTIKLGNVNLNIGQITSSALEAGQKALLSSIRTDILRSTLDDVLKGNVSKVVGTIVSREGEEWVAKTVSGEKIGSATDKKAAKEIAKDFKATANSKEIGKVSVDKLPTSAATKAEDGTPSVDVPAEGGGQVTLELNKPYQASDGSVWVYDGTNVKAFTDLQGAQASLAPVANVAKATVRKTGQEFSVRAGDYIETFKTKAEATAAAQAYNTGKTVNPTKVASGKKPALDLTPVPQLSFADLGKNKVATKEGTALKKVLKKVDELASQTPGRKIRLAMNNQVLLRRIISSGYITNPDSLRYLHRTFRKDFENAIKLARVEGELETPYTLLKMLQVASKGDSADAKNAEWISSLVSNIVIRLENKTIPLGMLPETFPDFVNDVPSYVAKQVGEKLTQILNTATELAKSKNPIARSEQRSYDSLISVFGEEVAQQVKATGILKANTEEAGRKYKLLEAKLLNQYENVTYKNLNELIAGLRSGESVNADALLKIFKEIDPENKITKSTVKALDNGTGAMLRDVFLKEGTEAIADIKKKVALSGDVEELMSISGIGYDDLLAQAIKYMKKPTKAGAIDFISKTKLDDKWIQNAILKESRTEQAKLFSESVSPMFGTSWNSGDDIIVAGLREAWTNKIDYIAEIERSADYTEGISSLGQKVKKVSKENYVSETGAVLPNVFGQNEELRMIYKIVNYTRARMEKGIKAKGGENTLTPASALGKAKQTELRNISADKQIDEMIYQMDLGSALLSFQGVRITKLKDANDAAFESAYKAEVELAKLENRPVKYARAKDAHFAYLHMGDIFRAFTENGARDLLRQGFFPVSSKQNAGKNTISWWGISDASRRVLELDGKEMLVDNVALVEELTSRILQKSPKMGKPTAEFLSKRKELAAQMAEHLIKPETIASLREAHLTKAVASADRFMKESETITDDILNTMRDGMRAAALVGDTADSVRLEMVRQYVRRLALAGNIFSVQNGRYAEDIFNAYAMQFADYGKLPVSPDAPEGTILKIFDDQEKKLLRTQLYLLDMHAAPERAQIQAAAGLKYKKPAELEAIQNSLTFAQEVFDEAMSRIVAVRNGSPDEIAAWESEYQKVKKLLIKARKAAVESGLPTFHYQGGKWVPSDQYNPEIARQLAEEMDAAYIAGQAGLMAKSMVDDIPVVPEYKLLTGKKLKDALQRENVILTNGRVANSMKHAEEIAASMTKKAGKNDEAIGDKAISALQELDEFNLKHLDSDMSLSPTVHLAEEVIPEVMRVDVEFKDLFSGDSDKAVPQFGEKFSSFKNKADIRALATRAETSGMLRSTNTARYLTMIKKDYKDVAPADFADALAYAVATGKIPKSVTGIQREIAMKVRPMVGPIREALKEMNKNGLLNSLERFGLNKTNGYVIDSKDLNENLEAIFNSLPFMKKGSSKTDDEQRRLQALKELAEKGIHPLQVLENLIKAVAITKAEQGLAANITANFGWKTSFDTFEQAVKAGWVAIESAGTQGKSNIINALPAPKDGGLFPPEIGEQIGASVRHWNEILTKPRNEIVRQVSQWTGLVKVFMTVNRLGYHALNLMSDLSTAIIRGTSPADIITGIRLTKKYVERTLPAEYGGLTNKIAEWTGKADALERQLRLVTKSWGEDAADIAKAEAQGFATTIRLVGAGGTVKSTKIDPDKLIEKMIDRGILEKNLYINAIQDLDDALILDGRDLVKAKLGQKIGARISSATQVAGKVGGDFASLYSNAIRAAHAQKIINSRVWRSVDEALDFVSDELAIFHPTNKSLGSFERRNASVVSTFYTWIRMAHVMVYRQVLENSRELYAINNALYYMNTLNGQQPQSKGTPYKEPEEVADWFRFRSGQLILPGATEEGALGIRTPFALYEVLNVWQFRFDAAEGINENVTSLGDQSLGVVAKSGPVIGQLAAKFALGTDPSTGRSVQYQTAGDVVKEFVNLLPAITGPAKGFFGVDIAQQSANIVDSILGSRPKLEEQKPLTPDQILISKLNNLLGVSGFQPESEASRMRAQQLEQTRLNKQLEDEFYKEQERILREGK